MLNNKGLVKDGTHEIIGNNQKHIYSIILPIQQIFPQHPLSGGAKDNMVSKSDTISPF